MHNGEWFKQIHNKERKTLIATIKSIKPIKRMKLFVAFYCFFLFPSKDFLNDLRNFKKKKSH